ncbi:MAG: MotA/TolQ/ExbB proton channel family protein [Proteobacteria bacterium]|nr:MotA/TolQ/ExbB proton channel family protein [Burkholderiales bacterium]
MDMQFGLVNLWTEGDIVTRITSLLLLAMSVASWMVILLKALDLRKYARQWGATERFWQSSDFAEGLDKLGGDPRNPFRTLATDAQAAARHHRAQSQSQVPLEVSDWLARCFRHSLDESTAQLQSGLAILASVGSTAPFVGLFGTVWGIHHALLSIGVAGQATIDRVAGPIGEALIMTALGLAVAIPAVLGYNALVRGNKSIVLKLNRFTRDLHAYYVTGARVSTGVATPAVALKQGS